MIKCTKPRSLLLADAVVPTVLLIIEICLETRIANKKYSTPAMINIVLTPKRIAVSTLRRFSPNKPDPAMSVKNGISSPSLHIFLVLLQELDHSIMMLLLMGVGHFQTEFLVLLQPFEQ